MKTICISPAGDISDSRYMRVPLGILYVAAVLEKEGHEIKMINVDLFKYTDEEVETIIKAEKPDIVAITTVTCNFNNGVKYAKIVKNINPEVITVIGGVHVSFTVNETLSKYPDLDFVVVGEGEITAKELWAELEKSKNRPLVLENFKKINGLAFKDEDGKIIKTEPRGFIQDLDSIPWPARHLVPVTGFKKSNVEAHVFASRGCAFNCKFCLLPQAEGSFRKRSAKNVVDEIEYLQKTYGYKVFKFVDNSFSTDKKTIHELCDELAARNLPIMWRCQTRVDLLNETIMKKMQQVGCKEILVGVESASDRILNEVYGKNLTVDSIRRIFNIGWNMGLVITPSFVLGYPDETPEELEETKQFIIELYKNNYRHPRMCYLTPFPGTEISDGVFDGKLSEFLEVTDWDKYTHICPTLRTKYMSRHELARIYVEALAEISAASEERVQRLWPEEDDPDQYSEPKIDLYLMKEAIIRENAKRVKILSEGKAV